MLNEKKPLQCNLLPGGGGGPCVGGGGGDGGPCVGGGGGDGGPCVGGGGTPPKTKECYVQKVLKVNKKQN